MAFLSVIVLSYNQESMIERCLNSILESDTNKVELIISDDCSRDDTVKYIDKWVNDNEEHFEKVIIIKNTVNIGTVRNLINAVEVSSAEYIKVIAADDWFLPGALDVIVTHCSGETFDVAFSSLKIAYQENDGKTNITGESLPASKIEGFFDMSSEVQYKHMTRKNCLRSPGAFFTRKFWEIIDLKNTNIKIVEDWAMWLKGVSLEQNYIEIPEIIVVYRQTPLSVSNNAVSPTYKKYLSDNAWVIKNISLKKKEWLSVFDSIYLIILWISIKLMLMMPLNVIARIEKIRKNKK
mgnify:FL=1